MSTPTPAPADRLQAQRVLAVSVIAAVPMLAVVAVILYGLEDYPSPVVAGGLFVLNLVAFGLAEAIGYRAPAIAPGTEPDIAQRQAFTAMQQSMMLRFAITEAPAILSFVGAALAGSAWVYLVGGFWSLLSLIWHVWPTRRSAAKLARSLEREGCPSHLVELFDGASVPGHQQY